MPRAQTTVYTIGYEGFVPDSFFALLAHRRIAVLVDVRDKAFSHKPGFSKAALKARAEAEGLEYVPLPLLGVPGVIRHSAPDMTAIRRVYKKELLPVRESEVCDLLALARARRCVLMCFENDPRNCHRGLLAERLVSLGMKKAEDLNCHP
jgi:uncharacterized protein (DUF488 family)